MSKIQKIDLNLGQKIANPFKTKRTSTTNPFKYSNFEGNTLQFADVFEGFEPKNTGKLKMISAAVMGSMTKLGSIFEPLTNLVNRVKNSMSYAWDYAKNTNLSDVKGMKEISSIMQMDVIDIGKDITGSISGSISNIKNSISGKLSILNTDITELSKGINDKWVSLIGKINTNKISKDTSVAELKSMWEAEIAAAKEVA